MQGSKDRAHLEQLLVSAGNRIQPQVRLGYRENGFVGEVEEGGAHGGRQLKGPQGCHGRGGAAAGVSWQQNSAPGAAWGQRGGMQVS